MKPGPASAKQILIGTIRVDAEPKAAEEWLTEISLEQGWFSSESEAYEAAEKWRGRFIDSLRRELSEFNEIGRFIPFDFNSSSDYLIQGCAFIEPRDSDEVKSAKLRQAQYYDYTNALTDLSPKEFEALCGGLLQLFGVEDPQVTSYSADEGIDFFGRLNLDQFMFTEDTYSNIQNQLSVWMIGQAKHYIKVQSSTFEIRELVGSVELAKGGAYGALKAKYEGLRIKVCDPVFYLFFTTGRISLNSWRVISKSGVIAMDGDMVATFLAQRAIGVDDDGTFQLAAFKDWVAKYVT